MNVFEYRDLRIAADPLEKLAPDKDPLIPKAAPRPSQPCKQPKSIEQREPWLEPDSKGAKVRRTLFEKSLQAYDRSPGQSSIAMQEQQNVAPCNSCSGVELLRAASIGRDSTTATVALGILAGTIPTASIDHDDLEHPRLHRQSFEREPERG